MHAHNLRGWWLLPVLVALLVTGCAPPMTSRPDDSALSELVKETVEGVRRQTAPDPRLAVFEVSAAVKQGVATLTGRVMSSRQRDALDQAVGAVAGLARVENQVTVLPDPGLLPKDYALANRPVVNLGLRPGEDTGESLATQAALGETLRLLDQRDNWYLVQMWDGYLGWVNGNSIVRMGKEELDRYHAGRQAEITAKDTVLRDPESGCSLLQAVQGVVLPLMSDPEAERVTVMLPDGRSASVARTDVRIHQDAVAAFATKKGIEAVIATARQYVGLPYLWGGTTSQGFDCSGFTQFVLRVNGYPVLRDADQQFTQGEPVDRGNLKRGDLVFFSTYRPGPSHMGIYLGDGEFIHSSGSLGVAISSLNPSAPNYLADLDRKFLGARRIIK